MVNTTYECMRQLKAQGLPSEHWGMIIVHSLHERLDPATARQWELARQSEMPEWEEMARFLERQANAMPAEQREQPSTSSAVTGIVRRERGQANMCEACAAAHSLYHCEQFLSLNLSARKHFVLARKLCPNCLRKGHGADGCFKGACVRCPGKKHNSVLCDAASSTAVANAAAMNMSIDKASNFKINNKRYEKPFIEGEPPDILLPTVLVRLEVGAICYGPVRALLDTGAQPNMMCASFQERNGLICCNDKNSIRGIGGVSLRHIEEVFWILPKNSGWPLTLPNRTIEPLSINVHVKELADPGYWCSASVELLIGAGALSRAITAVIGRDERGIVLFKSIFWDHSLRGSTK